jgi:tetratricopeptide (TPR) repeat protein
MSLPLLAAGEFARVTPILEQALKAPTESIGNHILYAALADAAAQQFDQLALRKYAPMAETLAERYHHRLYLAVAHRAWGVAHRLAGDFALAAGRLDQALRLFEDLNTRWQLGRTWLEFGELAKAQRRPAQARECFQRALDLFVAMRAAPDAQRARGALAATSQ